MTNGDAHAQSSPHNAVHSSSYLCSECIVMLATSSVSNVGMYTGSSMYYKLNSQQIKNVALHFLPRKSHHNFMFQEFPNL